MKRGILSEAEIELQKRIETEHTIFKYRMLASPASVIYDNSDRIAFHECVCRYFLYAENIDEKHVKACLKCDDIIGSLYGVYLKHEYLRYDTWEDIVEVLAHLAKEQGGCAGE